MKETNGINTIILTCTCGEPLAFTVNEKNFVVDPCDKCVQGETEVKKWKTGEDLKKGDLREHEGKVYIARKDIRTMGGRTPDKSPVSWEEYHKQKQKPKDLYEQEREFLLAQIERLEDGLIEVRRDIIDLNDRVPSWAQLG
jgi:hypothetical protein